MSICFMTRWRPDRGSGVLDEAEEESSEKSDHDLERAELRKKRCLDREKKRRRRYINKSKIKFVRHIEQDIFLFLVVFVFFFLRSKRYIVHN